MDVPAPWTLSWEGKQQVDSMRWKVKTAGISFGDLKRSEHVRIPSGKLT